jgi:ADP-dependent NAD(P)H-hydrate dehydratase / NAD(P)H-hydrate epimerase
VLSILGWFTNASQYNQAMALPIALYSTAQVRALDAHAIDELKIPGYTLMKRAGEAALRYLRTRWPMAHRIVIVCGSGNNAGDGYVLARFAQAAGLTVTVLAATDPEHLRGDARKAYQDFCASEGEVKPFAPEHLGVGEVIVDAILGTGLKGSVREDLAAAIRAVNAAATPVFALDVPSGLDSDAGTVAGDAIRADATVTFVGLKTGLYVGDGPEYAGTVFFDDLELSDAPQLGLAPRLTRIIEAEIHAVLPRRPRASNKGDFGRVLIVGSGSGYPGAARLAGEASLRVGAGLVTVAVAPENVVPIAAGRPELICLGVREEGVLKEALSHADVVAVGPGLGRTPWARAALHAALASGKPLVVDADALNLLAEGGAVPREDWILTPHPGEAGRLLGVSAQDVQHDRLAALDGLLDRYHGTVVLKGAGTLVGAPGRTPGLCERGNPGMATAGTGDVLTGTIAGILAQCADTWAAARVGVLVHAMAGDAAARGGERGVLATDLLRELPHCVNL